MPLVYLGTALLSAAVLLLQIALTRVFAIMLWHHFAYLVISIALLGYGAAGSLLARRGDGDRGSLAWRAAAFALAVAVGLPVAMWVGEMPPSFGLQNMDLARLAALYAIVTVPFLCAGLLIGAVLGRFRDHVNRVYCADLLGAGAGGLAAVPLLEGIGAPAAIAFAVLLAALSAAAFWLREGARVRCGVAAAAGLFVFLGAWLPEGDPVAIPLAPGKELGKFTGQADRARWGATARIEINREFHGPLMLGGAWGKDVPRWPQRPVFQDGSAPTALFRTDGDLAAMPFLGRSTAALPYRLLERPGQVLVIGVGGGIDVLTALFHGAGHVTGAEVNRAMVETLDEFADYTGRVFERPDVEIHVAEGRSFVRHGGQHYDLIQLSGVDTFTALSSGAYALAESYLYTVEAVDDFLSHLRPGGLLAVARFHMDPPREALRFAAIVQEALWRRGAADPGRHVFVSGGLMGVTLVRNEPFTVAEARELSSFAWEQGFGAAYEPYTPRESPFDRLLRCGDRAARDRFLDGYRFDVSPCFDDRPFFFNYFKWSNLGQAGFAEAPHVYFEEFPLGHVILLAGVVQILLLAALLILWPLRRLGPRGDVRGLRLPTVAWFGALGLGFMLLEVALMQKLTVFLGHPVYAISLVLATLLVATGAGSLLSARLPADRRTIRRLAVAVPAWLLLTVLVLPPVTELGLGLAEPLRLAIAVCLVAPMGVLLGCPFPLGLRLLAARAPGMVPWAFGINAFASVLGGLLAVLIAMEIGLQRVMLLATAVYLLGILAGLRLALGAGAAPGADAAEGAAPPGRAAASPELSGPVR